MNKIVKIFQIGKKIWPFIQTAISIFSDLISRHVNIFHVHVEAIKVEVGAPIEVDGKVQLPIVIHATIELPHVDGTAISGIDTQSIAAHITNALQSADIPEDDTDITLHLKDSAA